MERMPLLLLPVGELGHAMLQNIAKDAFLLPGLFIRHPLRRSTKLPIINTCVRVAVAAQVGVAAQAAVCGCGRR